MRTTDQTNDAQQAVSVYVSVLLAMLLTAVGCRKDEQNSSAFQKNVEELQVKETSASAERGDALAQYNLGLSYELGQGLPTNYQTASLWLRKAARQGYAAAQYRIGMLIINGHVTPTENDEAANWIQKAAAQQYPDAEFAL